MSTANPKAVSSWVRGQAPAAVDNDSLRARANGVHLKVSLESLQHGLCSRPAADLPSLHAGLTGLLACQKFHAVACAAGVMSGFECNTQRSDPGKLSRFPAGTWHVRRMAATFHG